MEHSRREENTFTMCVNRLARSLALILTLSHLYGGRSVKGHIHLYGHNV